MEFDMLRQKAEARMLVGSGSSDEFVSVMCMQNADPPKNEHTLELASLRNTLASRKYRLRCVACLVRVAMPRAKAIS